MGSCVSSNSSKRRGSTRYVTDTDDERAPSKDPRGHGHGSGSKQRNGSSGGGGGSHRRSRSADKAERGTAPHTGKRSSGGSGGGGSRESSRSHTTDKGAHRRARSASKERRVCRPDRKEGVSASSSAAADAQPRCFVQSLNLASTSDSAVVDWQSRAALLTSSSASEAQVNSAEYDDDWQRGMLDIMEEQSIQAYDMDTSQMGNEGAAGGTGGGTAAGAARRYSNSLLGFSSQSAAPFSVDSPAAAGTGRTHGRGTLGSRAAFSFGSLSALEQGSASPGGAASQPAIAAHPTILVVDEHPSTRQIISKWLANSKFTEISCATGDQAQSILAPSPSAAAAAAGPASAQHAVDVIVADVNAVVEQGQGAEPMLLLDWVVTAAQPRIASIPVIVLSSNLPSQGLERLLRRGAWDALHKPLNRAVFLNALATVFNTRRQRAFVERLRAKGDEYKERYLSRAKLAFSPQLQPQSPPQQQLFQSPQPHQSLQHPLAPPSHSLPASVPGSAATSMPTTPLFGTHALATVATPQSPQQQPQSGRGSMQLPHGSGSVTLQPITVLVVETDPVIIARLTEWIQTSSVRLRVVHTLAEAVTVLRESQKQAVMAATAANHSPTFMLGAAHPLLGSANASGSGGAKRLANHRSLSTAPAPTDNSPVLSPALGAAPAPVPAPAAVSTGPSSAAAASAAALSGFTSGFASGSASGSASCAIASTTAAPACDSSAGPASTLVAPSSFSPMSPSQTNGNGEGGGAATGAETAAADAPPLPPLPGPALSSPPLVAPIPRSPSLVGAAPSPVLHPTSPWSHTRLTPLPHVFAAAPASFGIELIIISHDLLIPPEVSAELMGLSATDPVDAAAPPTVGAESGDDSGDEGLAAVAAGGSASAAAPLRTSRTTVFMSPGLAASQMLVDLTLQPVLGKRRKLPVVCLCDIDGPSPVGMALLKHVALTIFHRPLSQGLVNSKMGLLLELIEQNRLGLLLARRANMYRALLKQLQSHPHDAAEATESNLADEHAASAAGAVTTSPHTPGRRLGHGEFRSRLLSVERDHRLRSAQSGNGHGSPTRGPFNDAGSSSSKRRGSAATGAAARSDSPFLIGPGIVAGDSNTAGAIVATPSTLSPRPPSVAINNASLRAPMRRSHSLAGSDGSGSPSGNGNGTGSSGGFDLPAAPAARTTRQHSDGVADHLLSVPPHGHASSRAMVSSSTLLHAAESQATQAPPRTNTPPITVHRPMLRIRTESSNAQ